MKNSVAKAVNYLVKNRQFFTVAGENPKNEEIKPFVELAFCYNMIPDNQLHLYDFERIATYIEKEIAKGEFEVRFRNNINAISGIAILEEFSLRRGCTYFRALLVAYVENQKLDLQLERTPFRVMDLKYSLNKANIQDNLPPYEEIYAQTILGKHLSLYYLTPMSIYSITHTIFYMTDMGRKSAIHPLLLDRRLVLKTLILESIVRNDLDILAELLLCCFFLKLDQDTDFIDSIDTAIALILRSQCSDGSFPAPIDHNYLNKRKRFNERYHTTLVCIGALTWFMSRQN